MITYNHEQYLADAIQGVINQICDFKFELIIGEDCSQDSTRQIALDYEKQYPDIIRVIYSDQNVGMNANSRRIFDNANGKYIAYCEGDDFWCDRTKLSQQVALIENNPDISIVHSDWTRAHFVDNTWQYNYKKSMHRRVDNKYLQGYLAETWHYPKILRTCTILLLRSNLQKWYDSGLMNNQYLFGDSVLLSWITRQGNVAYLPAVTAVYRVSPNSALRSGNNARIALYRSALEFDNAAQVYFESIQANYSKCYRWDNTASLILWGIRAGNWSAIKDGLIDFGKNFSLFEFIKIGYTTLFMRLPTIQQQHKMIPDRKPFGISKP